jgi:hypothetical protein
MKHFLRALGLVAFGVFLLLLAARTIPVHVYDGFESSHLSRFRWTNRLYEPGAVVSEALGVRSGHRALAITVHSGDRPEAASESGAATERDELMESWWLFSGTGPPYVYSFSIFIPSDFPQTRERLVIAQWRQLCVGSPCNPDNPILALRYEIGRLQITRNDEQGKTLLYQSNEDVRGQWLDFRFVTRWDTTRKGIIDVTLQGLAVVHYQGPTIYQLGPGHPKQGHTIRFCQPTTHREYRNAG